MTRSSPSARLTASSAARQQRATYASVLLWLLPTVNDELVVHGQVVLISQKPDSEPPSRWAPRSTRQGEIVRPDNDNPDIAAPAAQCRPGVVTESAGIDAPRHRVRVWFGRYKIAEYTAEPVLAAQYEDAMRRR